MPLAEIVSLIPFTEILKQVISMAKNVKDFKSLFKDLVSTMQTLVPLVQEIDMLQERLDPGNEELIFLTKTLRRAKKVVRKCSHVRKYDAIKKRSYTEKIKGINNDLVKFCQIYLPLIQHKNMLRSLSLKMEEAPEHNSNVNSTRNEDDDEQRVILESFKDKGKGKMQAQDHQEDEQLAAALQESLNMQERARQKSTHRRRQQEQEVILESCMDKGKGKQLQEEDEQLVAAAIQESLDMEELSFRQAIQESIYLCQRQEQDEQIANALLFDESERITTNGSSSSTRDPLDKDDVQRVLWESFKDK